jgi:hypothetical protein
MKKTNQLLIKTLLISLITLNSLFAETITLKKDEKAPFDGILMDTDTAKKVRIAVIENEEKSEIIKSKDNIIKLQDLNVNLQETQINILTEKNFKLLKEKQYTDWEKIIWFSLGVIGTSLAVHGASKLAK